MLQSGLAQSSDALEKFSLLKDMIISDAKLLHGASRNGNARHFDLVTSSHSGSRTEYRVSLVVYNEVPKPGGKIDISPKVLEKSPTKTSLNSAAEELLKKVQEELWGVTGRM